VKHSNGVISHGATLKIYLKSVFPCKSNLFDLSRGSRGSVASKKLQLCPKCLALPLHLCEAFQWSHFLWRNTQNLLKNIFVVHRDTSWFLLWYIMVHHGTFWYIMVYCGTLWYIVVHRGTSWYIVVHRGTLWYIVVHRGTSWYIVVHRGTSRYIVVYRGTSWYICHIWDL
jgi:hypothetical protein